MSHTLIYTYTDESPMLATHSLLPIIKSFMKFCEVDVKRIDISLSGRILSKFLRNKTYPDGLDIIANLIEKNNSYIIKLPNISASVPQLKLAISELQGQGFNIPSYSENPSILCNKINKKYSTILGSAVNPVLRQGNSDRRVALSIKQYAKKNPHFISEWKTNTKTHVSSMRHGDFYGNEQSIIISENKKITITFEDSSGYKKVLKSNLELGKEDVIDCSYMQVKQLKHFFKQELKDAKEKKILFSLHLKATMMKVSDPIIFGHAVYSYYENIFVKYDSLFKKINILPKNGLNDFYSKIKNLDQKYQDEIYKDLKNTDCDSPELAMIDSENGLSNLHMPNNVIIDASMPAMISAGGKMWDKKGCLQDVKAVIPDRTYAAIYEEAINFFNKNGMLDPKKMGSFSNIGLMAFKAEEYGSHDKTFEAENDGKFLIADEQGNVLLSSKVSKGDIWRMCVTKDLAIRNWVKLAYNAAKSRNLPTIFWLDNERAHDIQIIKRVKFYLNSYDLSNLNISIESPTIAMRKTLGLLSQEKDVISVTGNVLRDYLTDLFPILELGTSAKMLSIIPLLSGSMLYETGAGGSAPKHFNHFIRENHLNWNSLGEFLAIGIAFEHLSSRISNSKVNIFSKCINLANSKILDKNKFPSRGIGKLDTRGSHFYWALYLAQELSNQNESEELKSIFCPVFQSLLNNKETILRDLSTTQGTQVDLGGYYHVDYEKVSKIMRPSKIFNKIIDYF